MEQTSNQTSNQTAQVLREKFGFDEFRSGQGEVIEHLVAGRSAAAVFPTGGGKSLCYQLPALVLPGLTLVVSPLIALMKDQIDALHVRGIRAARLDSSLSAEDYQATMAGIHEGSLRLLYVAPERFNNERFRGMLGQLRVSLLAVDEAHCISEWGHNFRPDYLKLARFSRECGAERILALTATATPRVLEDICREFEIAAECGIRTAFHRPNLQLLSTPTAPGARDDLLLQRLRERPRGATIVYVTLQKTAEQVAATLAATGLPARAYHAGLAPEQRTETQDWFVASGDAIVVATIAFGMGIDKRDIRYIYHYNLAKSLENYAQEIGRAGRDGQPAVCESLVALEDLRTLENFVHGDTPDARAVQSLIREIFGLDEQFGISISQLSGRHDIRDLVVRTMLTYLELDGYLEGGTPYYADYRFQPQAASREILDRFAGSRREFLATLFRQARKAGRWFTLDVDQAARATGSDRQRVIRALDYLADAQLLQLKVAGVHHRYKRLRQPDDVQALADSLHQRMLGRQQAELKRLGQLVDLMRAGSCQASTLGAYFGEPLSQPCGQCTWCLSEQKGKGKGKPLKLAIPPPPPLDTKRWEAALALRRDRTPILDSPRSFARFLCGVKSPSLTRAKLTRHDLFGSLSETPFDQILARCETDSVQ